MTRISRHQICLMMHRRMMRKMLINYAIALVNFMRRWMRRMSCRNALDLKTHRRFIVMEKWRISEIIQSELNKHAVQNFKWHPVIIFFKFQKIRYFHSKPKLERIENLVVCYHNTTEFDVNLLKYFAKLKCFFIGYSSFEKFVGKIPHLEHLKVRNCP